MTADAARTYLEVLSDLLRKRAAAGGSLAPDVEAPLVGALDACWRRMSEEEQASAEASTSALLGRPA